MMTVLANSLAVAALNRREREARVLNAGSFMHGSQARRMENARGPPVTSRAAWRGGRSEEHTSELQSLMRISYAVFCLKKKKTKHTPRASTHHIKDVKHEKIRRQGD